MTTDSTSTTTDERFRPNIELAHQAVDLLADRQVSDIVLLDLTPLGAFADYFVIGTVDNIRQARAAIDAVQAGLDVTGPRIRPEGDPESGWVLLDTLEGVLVHLFSLEDRARYDLEGLWGRAQEVVRVQ